MRIGMFTDCYRPAVNGVVTSIESTIEYLRSRGHDVYLFAPQSGIDMDGGHKELRFSAFTFPFHREQRVAVPFPWDRFQEIGRLQLDIIHVHTPFAVGLMGRYWSDKKKIPLIYTHHTHFEEYVHYIPLPKKVLKHLAVEWPKNFCQKCRAVIAPSKAIKKVLETYGITKPVYVWPSPIDLSCYQKGDKEDVFRKFPEWKKKFRLLYVGRLGKEKGLDFLLKALRILKDKDVNAGLLIVGDGPYRGAVLDLVQQYNLQDYVWFAGRVMRERVCNYYAASELFVFSSVTETQGLVVAEALAAGCPVVAVDAPGVNEAFSNGNGGALTPPEPALFAEEVASLLNNQEERLRQGNLARMQANRFSWDILGKELEVIYEEVVNSKNKKFLTV